MLQLGDLTGGLFRFGKESNDLLCVQDDYSMLQLGDFTGGLFLDEICNVNRTDL